MPQAFIIDAVRSPMGRIKPGGAFTELHPVELLSQVMKAIVQRNNLDPGQVDDIICGCVSQVGEQSGTPGRMAWLAAGYPEHVPSTTIDRKCGSSQQAVHFAAQGIASGAYDIAIACGVESMSRVPMGISKMGKDSAGPGMSARYTPGLVSQGIASELIGARWKLGRAELDQFAARSHQRAAAAQAAGQFQREIVPIQVDERTITEDETIRASTTAEGLAGLRPAFADNEMSKRFPQIAWQTTAGNSSQMTDGASAMLLMSEQAAERLGATARARFVAFDVRGDSPLEMLTAPIPSSQMALKKAGLSVGDIDHFEINEAFATVPLAWLKELDADPVRLNPRGGAIALGHPLGASGVRLMCTMLHALEDTGGRFGLQAMCEAGGMANTTIIERLA